MGSPQCCVGHSALAGIRASGGGFGQRHPQRFARCSYEALQSNLEHSLRELLPMVGLSVTDPIVDHMLSTQRADLSAADSSGYRMRGSWPCVSP